MKKIGYFKIIEDNGKFVGGIMIADNRGLPVEFKYTDPIVPTKIQKVLYGEVLEKFLREEVIISNIVNKIENKPEVYFVDNEENEVFQNFVREEVLIAKRTQLKAFKEAKLYKFVKEREAVIQLGASINPTRIVFCKEDLSAKEEMMKNLGEVGEGMDIVEPLERMEEALKLICRGEL